MIMRILACAAIAALIATPAGAQSPRENGTAFSSYAQGSSKAKTTKPKRSVRTTVTHLSPHSTNPEYDVYVRGEYVGSDPDPRIRWSLRREAIRNYGLSD
jgi:hypothetical protein